MIPVQFVFVAVLFNVVGMTSYIADTLRGRSHPNRVTFALWSVAPLIAFAAQIQKGVGLTSLLTFMVGFGPLLVLLASFVDRRAYARVTRFDLSCGALSIVALVAWRVTGNGNVAIVFSLLADLLAAVPTLRKAYRVPHTETAMAYLCSGISALITMLTITNWDFATASFPIYIACMSTVLYMLVRFPRLRPASAAAA